MTQTRNQEYKYQYKTVAAADMSFCGNGPRLNVSIPDNLLDIKAIYMHAVLRFSLSVPAGKRKIYYAGGEYPVTGSGIPIPTEGNLYFVDKAADPVSRIVDLKLDITELKDGLMEDSPDTLDQPTMELNLITDIDGAFDSDGEVILWKIDFVYTTLGIQ